MIVVDVETTGLIPEKHSIVSIGAIDFKNPLNQFYEECQTRENSEISQEALNVNGFTIEQIQDTRKKTLSEVMKAFLEWADSCEYKILGGHNTWFDVSFLKHSAELSGIKWLFNQRIIDLHSLAFTEHLKRNISPPLKPDRTSSLSMDSVLKLVGLPPEPKPHNALIGAKMDAEAFSRLILGKRLLKEFDEFRLPEYLKR